MLQEFYQIVLFVKGAFLHALPFILITIPLAVFVNVSGISKYINKAFQNKALLAILLATIVGAFSPFCSCGVIPIISALLISGVPIAPVMTFWLASPSMDPEIFFLSVSLLGLDLAVWRLAATFVLSLSAGYITHFLVKIKWLNSQVLKTPQEKKTQWQFINPLSLIKTKLTPAFQYTSSGFKPSNSCGTECSKNESLSQNAKESKAQDCTESSCESSVDLKENWIPKILKETMKISLMILKFMTLAFFLEAIIVRYIPSSLIVNLLGKNNQFAIVSSTLIGVPLYTTNLTALGLVKGLLQQGMLPGAALSFLVGGAITTIPAMAAVLSLVKKRVFILYISFALLGALLSGYVYHVVSILSQ